MLYLTLLRAIYAFEDVISIEPCESPTPNSISLTCTTSEERLSFLNHRCGLIVFICERDLRKHRER